MSRNNLLIIGGAVIGVIILAWLFMGSSTAEAEIEIVYPKTGDFKIEVTTTGELRAKNSVDVKGPINLRKAQLGQVKIVDLVPEGTQIDSGDVVGRLDVTELANKIQDISINIQKYETELEQVKLDCTLTMAQSREEIVNLKYAMEERKLEWEQSTFEPPSTQRQAKIEHEKATRAYNQAVESYVTKEKQSEAKMRIAESDLLKEMNKFQSFQELLGQFTVKAKQPGMVIYFREWGGEKRVVGSTINAWEPVIATLPDLSEMESITYVNEVDRQKVDTGQRVTVTFDAIPNKKAEGKIIHVAQVPQELKNSDAKVFEVKVKLMGTDNTLRPGMTTGNQIHIETIPNKVYLQLEAIFSTDESNFVYLKSGGDVVKQEVKLGKINDNFAVIEAGVKDGDQILLNPPENSDDLQFRKVEERK